MKLRAKLVYVRDHDLGHGPVGIQKIYQFQTEGGSDIRLTTLVHVGDHEGGPVPTVKHRFDALSPEEQTKHIAAGIKPVIANQHHKENSYMELTVPGDEGKEYEITVTEVKSSQAA